MTRPINATDQPLRSLEDETEFRETGHGTGVEQLVRCQGCVGGTAKERAQSIRQSEQPDEFENRRFKQGC